MQMCKTLLYFDIPRTVSVLRILQRYQQQRLTMDDKLLGPFFFFFEKYKLLGPKYGPRVVFWSVLRLNWVPIPPFPCNCFLFLLTK